MGKIILVNLKMFLNSKEEVCEYQKKISKYKSKFIVFPQNIYLEKFIKNDFIVGSQNISDKENGPYTGEVSAKSIKDLGAQYTLIGHYEVKQKNKEENDLIKEKVKQALKNNLKVILCIGENIEDKNKGKTKEIIENQLRKIKPNENIIVSYEPTYSINSNVNPTNEEIINVIKLIKNLGYRQVLYGGNVNTDNIKNLNNIDIIDGFLIGSDALKSSNLIKIIEVVK